MKGGRALAAALLGALFVLALPALARAADQQLVLDPASTKVSFLLGSTYHDVEGRLPVTEGAIRFDAATGAASGEIVLDARQAETGNGRRDRKMHREVLESERFPQIVFRPTRLEVLHRDATTADVKLHGELQMHGETRPVVIPAHLEAKGERIAITAKFPVHYVDWGMKNISSFLLRVADGVDVTIAAEGTLGTPGAAGGGSGD